MRRTTYRTLNRTITSAVASMVVSAASAQVATIANAPPPYVRTAQVLGAADPTQVIDITIWLQPHGQAGLDALARDLYTPGNASFRHWLTQSAFTARFAPSAAEAQTVKDFLASNNLQVLHAGPGNFFVRARGTVADVGSAFQLHLLNYAVRGKTLRANDRAPVITGEAGALVRAVEGLDSGTYDHPVLVRSTAGVAPPSGQSAATATAAAPDFFTPSCFAVQSQTFSTNNENQLPIGHYTGNHINLNSLTSAGCGYTPQPLYTAYNLAGLYAEGFTGKGQTIAILDWCGSSTIMQDANEFSRRFGLPALTSANFQIIYTPTPSTCISEDQVEINLDVEWAHAIAPGATIDLVVPPSATFQDVDAGEFYAVNYGLANSISGSFGSPESETPAAVLQTQNFISEMAAVTGISTNYSSGDNGDFSSRGLLTVNAPADSPWATAVGGTSLALNKDNSIAWQTGWGTTETLLAQNGFIADPPEPLAFAFGSGGGPSTCATQDSSGNCLAGFPKPAFQRAVPGHARQVPDIAWLADPFTGAVVAITVPAQKPSLVWEVIGGTSLAAPMFSALWAIANEEAGAPLGQAAASLYSMPAGTITDILPVSSPSNVRARIREPGTVNVYPPRQTVGGTTASIERPFVSALWDYGSDPLAAAAVTFGTDCGVSTVEFGTPCTSATALHTGTGWDNVTGLGVPNGQSFADFFRSSSVSPE